MLATLAWAMTGSGCGSSQFVRGDGGLSGVEAGRYTQVVTSPLFACALREDGEPVCWGYARSEGLDVAPGPFTMLAASEYGVCGLRPDRTVACWGRNFSNTKPVAAPSGTYTSITGGHTGFCGLLTEGGVWCWGDAELGFVPGEVPYRSVHIGTDDICVLREDGRAECAGTDVPGSMTPPEDELIAMDMGWAIACGVRADGTAVCWGLGEDEASWSRRTPLGDLAAGAAGELDLVSTRSAMEQAQRARMKAQITGNGMDQVHAQAAMLAAGLIAAGVPEAIGAAAIRKGGILESVQGSNLQSISVGILGEICGVDRSGAVTCWGALAPDRFGKHGPVQPAPGPYVQVDTSATYACGLRQDGRVACWGDGFKGRCAPPGSPAAQ